MVVVKMNYSYLDFLAYLGVGGAHPGGLQLTRQLLSAEKLDDRTILLDAGCGTGQTSVYIKSEYDCSVIALDINPLMLEKAQRRFDTAGLSIPVVEGNLENLPFKDNHFDIVLSESVLAFTDTNRSLSEIRRVLKEDGVFIAVEMAVEKAKAEEKLQVASDFYGFSTVLTEKEWKERFTVAGFPHVESLPFHETAFEAGETADFWLSANIDDELVNMFHQHLNLSASHKDILGFRVFRCR